MVSAKFLREYFRSITVEPIQAMMMMGWGICAVAQAATLRMAVCNRIYLGTTQSCDLEELSKSEEASLRVTEVSVQWQSWLRLATVLPAVVADIVLGAYGDQHGRLINILLGLVGNIVDFYRFILLCAFLWFPFWAAIVVSVVNGFTGYIQIVFTSGSAYLADTTVDPDLLTIKLTGLAAWGQISWAFINLVSVFLLNWMSLFLLQVIGMSFSCVAFFYALWRIKHVPPLRMKAFMRQKKRLEDAKAKKTDDYSDDTTSGSETDNLKSSESADTLVIPEIQHQTWLQFSKEVALSLKDTVQTYSRPRRHFKRLKLCLCLCIYVAENLASTIYVLIYQYVQGPPFNWKPTTMATYFTVAGIMQAVGNLGAIPLKKYVKLKDTTILLIATVCLTANHLIFGFATHTWMAYLSLVVGAPGLMLTPALQSYTARQVAPDEIGKVYATYGITNNLTILFAQIFYPYIYTATAEVFPGLVYIINAVMTALCLIPILIVHLLELKDREKESSE